MRLNDLKSTNEPATGKPSRVYPLTPSPYPLPLSGRGPWGRTLNRSVRASSGPIGHGMMRADLMAEQSLDSMIQATVARRQALSDNWQEIIREERRPNMNHDGVAETNRNAYCICIDTLCEGRVPSVRDADGEICLFSTRAEAEHEIADLVITRLQEFVVGERDFENAMTLEEYVVEVDILPDGSVIDSEDNLLRNSYGRSREM